MHHTAHTWGCTYSVEVLLGFQLLPKDGRSLATEFNLYLKRHTLYFFRNSYQYIVQRQITINYPSRSTTCGDRLFFLAGQLAAACNFSELIITLVSPLTLSRTPYRLLWKPWVEVCVYIAILSILLYYNTDQVCTCKYLTLWSKELEGFNLCSESLSESLPRNIKECEI